MVVPKRLCFTLCNCGAPFSGENFKKHVQSHNRKGETGHCKEARVYYCAACNEWGSEGEEFSHSSHLHVRLSKPDMKRALQRLEPLERSKLVRLAQEKQADEEKKLKTNKQLCEDIFGTVSSDDEELPKTEVEEAVSNLLKIRRQEVDEVHSITSVSNAKDEEEEVKKRRAKVDLDSSSSTSSSDSDEPSSKVPRTSSPIREAPPPLRLSPVEGKSEAFFLPRAHVVEASQTFARNLLVDKNSKLTNKVAELTKTVAMYRGKEDLTKRLTQDLVRKEEEKKEILVRLETAEKRSERERKESDEKVKAMEDRMKAMEEKMKELDSLKNEVKEKEKEVAKLHRVLEARGSATLHVECNNGIVGAQHIEQFDEDGTIYCFSKPTTGVRCHHISIKGSNVSCKAKNVRWPGES